MASYVLVFDKVILKQLKKAARNEQVREILRKMLDKIQASGPNAGSLLDSHLFMYEIKCKHPPIRLYYRHRSNSNEIEVFEFEMKTSEEQQKETIQKLRKKVLKS